jgi:phospholipase/lecithinase/hemolysin
MSKGDHRRPLSVDPETFAENWERAFRKRQKDARQSLQDAAEEVFSETGIRDLEEPPRAREGDRQTEDASPPGQPPQVEGS